MTGVTVHVTLVNVTGAYERHHVPQLLHVAMVALGKLSAMNGQSHIHTVPTRSAFTQVDVCQCASLTTSSLSNLEAETMQATTNHSVAHATTIRLHTMAVATGEGVGAKKVLTWGRRPAGQSCACTREIRQGGV
jgi:hypothetical protein